MVHHFLEQCAPLTGRCRRLVAYSDSCGGQNRNFTFLHYFMARVALVRPATPWVALTATQGYHEQVDWHFLLRGHTKFAPDGHFGMIRQAEASDSPSACHLCQPSTHSDPRSVTTSGIWRGGGR